MPDLQNENLKREIGLRSLTLAIINSTVGTGIFVIPAIIAQTLDAAAIIAYIVCGALIFLIALCFAEVGSKTNVTGGTYAYIQSAFGPFAGFIANNIYWFGACVISDAAFANALADTLKHFFPFLGNEAYRAMFFLILFAGLALLNIRSVKHGVRFIEITTLAKLLPLLLLVVAGSAFVSTNNLAWTISPTVNNIGAASLLLFFAFMGMETPLSNGGEIKNAKRTVPLAILFGITLVLVLYMSIQVVTQGVLGDSITAHKDAPLAAVAGIVMGKAGMIIIIITTAISMLGVLGGDILSIPRILYAGARNGIMPKALAKVHPHFQTPHAAIIVYVSLDFLMSVSGGFAQLAILASAALLLIYLGIVLATIKLRNIKLPNNEKTFRVPGGVIIPLLATCVIIWLLSNLSKAELTGIAIFIILLSVIYFLLKWVRKASLK